MITTTKIIYKCNQKGWWAMIRISAYHTFAFWKKEKFFLFFKKNLLFGVEKEVKVEIKPRNIAHKEYYYFLNGLFNKYNDTHSICPKYDNMTQLEEKYKAQHTASEKMNLKSLNI